MKIKDVKEELSKRERLPGKSGKQKKIETFSVIPPPEEMARRDEILAKSYQDLLFFGRAFLPKDFMYKSASPLVIIPYLKDSSRPNPVSVSVLYFLGVLVSPFYLNQLFYINFALLVRMTRTLLLGYQKNRVRPLTT